MEKKEKLSTGLITDNGEQLNTKEEIIEYLGQTRELLKQIRKTPKFASDFREGNMDSYNALEEMLRLSSTPDNQKLTTDEVYEWVESNKIK